MTVRRLLLIPTIAVAAITAACTTSTSTTSGTPQSPTLGPPPTVSAEAARAAFCRDLGSAEQLLGRVSTASSSEVPSIRNSIESVSTHLLQEAQQLRQTGQTDLATAAQEAGFSIDTLGGLIGGSVPATVKTTAKAAADQLAAIPAGSCPGMATESMTPSPSPSA